MDNKKRKNKKFANMSFCQITNTEITLLTEADANGSVWSVFSFLKCNIDLDTGRLKKTIGDENLNYTTIANRLGIHRTTVRRAIEFLNDHNFIDTYLLIQVRGEIKTHITKGDDS